ncbi:hypothetical protein HETIRDRAFT_37203 [Heterobasidion irregulare TC 32-1]|uniref:Plus3 domain-containing protein n=1 Tax=Heterobasidion irregulare (strain TC 32-1) TaxID=747525 RepID=W4JV70_HETIT|nr:uncharacterized protein HETIRDRAFT_37203 [Heterobasidion irregulare TC 32-1]ETW77432.1 hypothetical protein HETIRDRAFT_37203 [Heterobasidion irregulare TC 32-1]
MATDSEGDFSDELLELAGASEKKRKRRQTKSSRSKRRKPDVALDTSEDEPESEEEIEDLNPYPFDGKYIDEADRQNLLSMPEIEREEVLAQRLEEMQRIQDKRNLIQMLKAQKSGDGDTVSKAAKRHHAVRGATKEKSSKLDELKAKRKAKDEKKRFHMSPKREHSASSMEMETDSAEEEDGQISKLEEEEEKERKLLNRAHPDEDRVTLQDLEKVRLSRDMLAKHYLSPWFEEYVKGAWVRYLIGVDDGQPVYRICEIQSLSIDSIKPYKINEQIANQTVDLKHGQSLRAFPMDKVSNAMFTQREFDRLMMVYEHDRLKMPGKRQIEKKNAQLIKLVSQPLTESDITAMLARKSQIQNHKQSGVSFTMEKSRLIQARTLALRRNDRAEVGNIDVQLRELADRAAVHNGQTGPEDEPDDILAKVNERNRKANMEAVRKAELLEAERKRKERKLARSGAGTPVPADPSARLRTVPRMYASRPSTPHANGTPSLGARAATSGSVSPLPPSTLSSGVSVSKGTPKKDFESQVLESIELDLRDF